MSTLNLEVGAINVDDDDDVNYDDDGVNDDNETGNNESSYMDTPTIPPSLPM